MQPAATPGRPVPALARTLAVTAAALAVVGGVLAGLATRQVSSSAATGATRTEALAAARQIAVDFAAYDYRHLAEDFKRVADASTGAFHTQYVTQSAGVKDLIEKEQAVSTAEVVAAGVSNVSAGRATVVLALDRVVKSKSNTKGTPDSLGLQMVLVHRDGHWLASQVNPL